MSQGEPEAKAILEREAGAARLKVPQGLRTLEADLQKASARIRAFGLEDPFREDRLRDLPPGVVRAAVGEAHRVGLMDDGSQWATRRDQVPDLVVGLHRTFQRQVDLDRDLPGLDRGR